MPRRPCGLSACQAVNVVIGQLSCPMSLPEFLSALSAAWGLLAAFPWSWVLIVVLFLVMVESLMFVPYVGFVLKLSVAGIVVAQIIALFAAAAIGQSPTPLALMSAFSLPATAQLALAASALVPFSAGILFLYIKGGPPAIAFFFGNILKTTPPSRELFEPFKYIMHMAALPFTFLPGVVVINGLTGIAAISVALKAAMTNWLPILLLGVISLGFEWCSVRFPSQLPKAVAVSLGSMLLVAYLVLSFALTYTVSATVLGQNVVSNSFSSPATIIK